MPDKDGRPEIEFARRPCRKCGLVHPGCAGHAKSKGGAPCGRVPIPGGYVCKNHGGALPGVRRKAELRLLELVPSAVATLAKVMIDPKAKDSDKIKASVAILDRAGFSPSAERTVGDAREVLTELLRAKQQAKIDAALNADSNAEPTTVPGEIVHDDQDQ